MWCGFGQVVDLRARCASGKDPQKQGGVYEIRYRGGVRIPTKGKPGESRGRKAKGPEGKRAMAARLLGRLLGTVDSRLAAAGKGGGVRAGVLCFCS